MMGEGGSVDKEDELEEEDNNGSSLVGFMFGNVDKNMRLEDDYLDEASNTLTPLDAQQIMHELF